MRKAPFHKERAFFSSLFEISDYSLLSYCFNSNLFAIAIRFLQTCRRILPHDSVSLSLAHDVRFVFLHSLFQHFAFRIKFNADTVRNWARCAGDLQKNPVL